MRFSFIVIALLALFQGVFGAAESESEKILESAAFIAAHRESQIKWDISDFYSKTSDELILSGAAPILYWDRMHSKKDFKNLIHVLENDLLVKLEWRCEINIKRFDFDRLDQAIAKAVHLETVSFNGCLISLVLAFAQLPTLRKMEVTVWPATFEEELTVLKKVSAPLFVTLKEGGVERACSLLTSLQALEELKIECYLVDRSKQLLNRLPVSFCINQAFIEAFKGNHTLKELDFQQHLFRGYLTFEEGCCHDFALALKDHPSLKELKGLSCPEEELPGFFKIFNKSKIETLGYYPHSFAEGKDVYKLLEKNGVLKEVGYHFRFSYKDLPNGMTPQILKEQAKDWVQWRKVREPEPGLLNFLLLPNFPSLRGKKISTYMAIDKTGLPQEPSSHPVSLKRAGSPAS